MPLFRLFNLEKLSTETFDLGGHPAYVAASYAWIDKTFNYRDDKFYDCFGGKGIRAIIDQTYSNIKYCWVDRLCINQKDKQDKLTQIPLMERIYSQATVVIIFINAEIGADQAQVDNVTAQLQGALKMWKTETWQEDGLFWQSDDGMQRIVGAMHGLLRLASTIWATRVWTLQEYVLAQKLFWIGLDLKPITFDDSILSALPDICNTLAIEECLGTEMQILYSSFHGMANVRLGNIDRTRVMELLGNRDTKHPVDAVYGAMSASGVIIRPIAGENESAAWRRWCEAALTQGNVRWILLPTNSHLQRNDREEWNCVMPYFALRDKFSASSGLDYVEPLRSVLVANGSVSLSARNLGTIKIVRRLGKLHAARNGGIHRDITLILFARAKQKFALQIISAFGGGRYDPDQTRDIAHVMVKSYMLALTHIINGTEEDFQPTLRNDLQRYIWNDFMQLQQSQMTGMNDGIGYLCQIPGNSAIGEITTVLTAGESIESSDLEALDFEAKTPSDRSVLMIVKRSPQDTGSLHKVGMTLPVSDQLSVQWTQLPVITVKLGGKDCYHCKTLQSESESHGQEQSASGEGETAGIDAWEAARSSAAKALQRRLATLLDQNQKMSVASKTIRRRSSTRLRYPWKS